MSNNDIVGPIEEQGFSWIFHSVDRSTRL